MSAYAGYLQDKRSYIELRNTIKPDYFIVRFY